MVIQILPARHPRRRCRRRTGRGDEPAPVAALLRVTRSGLTVASLL